MNMSVELFILSLVVTIQFALIHYLRRRLIESRRLLRQAGIEPDAEAEASPSQGPLPG